MVNGSSRTKLPMPREEWRARVERPRAREAAGCARRLAEARLDSRSDEPGSPVLAVAADRRGDRTAGGSAIARVLLDESKLQVRRRRPPLDLRRGDGV